MVTPANYGQSQHPIEIIAAAIAEERTVNTSETREQILARIAVEALEDAGYTIVRTP